MATKAYKRPATPIVPLSKFDLYGAAIGDGLKRPRFTWAVMGNNPRFGVFLNNPKTTDEKGDFIYSGYSMNIFMAILKSAEDFYSNDENTGKHITIVNRHNEVDEAGSNTGNLQVTSLLAFGIDDDGRRWLMAVDKKKKETPKVKFYLDCSDYHYFLDRDGKQMTQAMVSKLMAVGYIANIRAYFMNMSPVAGDALNAAEATSVTVGASAPKVTSTFDDDIPF